MPKRISVKRLRSVLRYDPETGKFFWRIVTSKKRCIKVGDEAGCGRTTNGYKVVGIDGRLYYQHRLAILYMTGTWPTWQVDHVNGRKKDNRWSNLREATDGENSWNRGKQLNNSTGFKGVIFSPTPGKFIAQCKKYLGTFSTAIEAHEAYKKEAKKRSGNFYYEEVI